MPYRLLVIDPHNDSCSIVERAFTAAGHLVTCVSTFDEGKQRLLLALPDLLITALKLGAFNGIQLVLLAHREVPDMPAVVLHDKYDAVLEEEAKNAGAVYMAPAKPLDEGALVALVERLLADAHVRATSPVPRQWPRKKTSLPARIGRDHAKVVEVSYSGLRLEVSGAPVEPLSRVASVFIPDLGIVPVHPVWARGATAAAGRWWCGAEVTPTGSDQGAAWRKFVDSVN